MRLWLYLSNENDEERMLRHKGDLPTTETDTNFIAVHREREKVKMETIICLTFRPPPPPRIVLPAQIRTFVRLK